MWVERTGREMEGPGGWSTSWSSVRVQGFPCLVYCGSHAVHESLRRILIEEVGTTAAAAGELSVVGVRGVGSRLFGEVGSGTTSEPRKIGISGRRKMENFSVEGPSCVWREDGHTEAAAGKRFGFLSLRFQRTTRASERQAGCAQASEVGL